MSETAHGTDTLQPLLARLAAGDDAAINQLIEHSVERLRHLAHVMLRRFPIVRPDNETDDVAQAASIRLLRALKEVKPTSARHFLSLAALQIRRELYDLARHQRGAEAAGPVQPIGPSPVCADGEEGPQGQDPAAPEPGPATQVCWRDLLCHVQDQLPEEEREVFDLIYIQQLSQEEAAQVLGVAVVTVKRRWRSARLLLHKSGLSAAAEK